MSATMSGPLAAAAIKAAVTRIGGAFTSDPAMHTAGAAAGYPDAALAVAGRAGVLGDAPAAVVTATLVFFPADHVARAWEAARRVSTPAQAAQTFARACHEWGRAHLTGVTRLDVLCPLVERIVAGADVAGLALFAAWRALPPPDDLPARAAHLLHVLREHRTGLHALVVLADGLSPLEAILAAPHGDTSAAFFGWTPPYPNVDGMRERWAAAEERTDALVGRAYAAALRPPELAQLAELLPAVRDAVYPPEQAAVE